MDKHTRKAIEDAGFRVTAVKEFLDLTDAENELVELRVAISRAVRAARERTGVSQKQLAKTLKSTQSRISGIEAAAPGVSLDLMLRSFFALGGKFENLARDMRTANAGQRRTAPVKRPYTAQMAAYYQKTSGEQTNRGASREIPKKGKGKATKA